VSVAENVPTTPERAWQTSAVILGMLPVTATLFALIALWLRGGEPTGDVGILTWVWLIQAFAEAVAIVFLWNRAVKPHIPASGFASDPDLLTLGSLTTGLIICMAMVEGLALFGIIIHLIGGTVILALISVILVWTGWFVCRPRRSWYGLR